MNPITHDLCDGTLQLWPDFLSLETADRFLNALMDEIPWRQDEITLFGRTHNIPRLQAFQGDAGIQYRYSRLTLDADPWSSTISSIKQALEEHSQQRFNAVLLNLYRNGNDSMGWHSDDEPELGPNPVIASVSLGNSRRFILRRKDNHTEKLELQLTHGSLLVMSGALQHHWQHSVPRTRTACEPRINLTFRQITG